MPIAQRLSDGERRTSPRVATTRCVYAIKIIVLNGQVKLTDATIHSSFQWAFPIHRPNKTLALLWQLMSIINSFY